MKKIVLIALSALLSFAACQKAPVAKTEEKTEVKEIIFKIAVNNAGDTKAVKTAWADGDKVYVFFSGVNYVKYATLTRSGENWTVGLEGITPAALVGANPTEMYAVFFPYEQPQIISDGGTGVKFKTGGHGNAAIDGLNIYTYYMTANSTCTVKDNGDGTATLTGTLNMAIPTDYVQFFIDKSSSDYNEDYRYRLSVQGVKPTACVSYAEGAFGTKVLNAAQPMWGYAHGTDGVAFSGVIDDTWETATSHIIYLFDTEAAAKSMTISGKTLSSHAAINISGTKYGSIISWSAAAVADNSPLACGETLWASFNLGATAEGTAALNYGWYFSWGDIVPQRETTGAPDNYGYSTYYNNTIAYEALNGKNVNLIGDYAIYDMATAILGSPWRLPTKDEYTTLFVSSTSWGENNSLSAQGVVFPAAGNWWKGAWSGGADVGHNWSSSYYDSVRAYFLRFRKIDPNKPSAPPVITPGESGIRYNALSVRPVQDATIVPANGTTGEGLLGEWQ